MYRIEKEIEAFYGRFAAENKISFSDAKRILTSSERKAFRMDLQEYIKKGEILNYSKEWSTVLENASSVARVNRLQSLQVQMAQQVEELHVKYNTGVTEMAQKVLNDGYYKNIFEIQKTEGIGSSFARLDTEKVKTIINTPWAPDGSNFSQRIWKNRTELVNYLNTELTQAFIRGERADRLIKELKKKFGVSSRDAARLVQTEAAFFSAKAKIESYKALGYTKYIIVAVMDGKTSEVCRELDGEVFDIEDFAPGKTAPPFHPRCRSTIAPYVSVGKKDAKGQLKDDKSGEMYSIPEDMTYEEWTEKYVVCRESDVLNNSSKKDIINTGGDAGAKKTDGWQDRHAELFYEEIRHRTTDVKRIADNTNFTKKAIEEIKQHMFFTEHDLGDGDIGRFTPDFEQAQVWDRLTQGKHTELDVMLLKHEYVELTQMRLHGYDYPTAHEIANKRFNWGYAIRRLENARNER